MYGNEPTVFEFRGLFGVRVEVKQSLIWLAGLYLLLSAMSARGLVDAGILVALIVASIYLHELGHAWGCRVQGVAVHRIVIFGGGGFCEHARARNTQDELIVAMGPIVNLALWAVTSLAVGYLFDATLAVGRHDPWLLQVMIWGDTFAMINFALFLFNLVPVQPLDGGKLLHLVLLRLVPPGRALRIAGTVGVVFSVLWWPGLLYLYLTSGWLLLFAPSLRQHLAMMRGQIGG
jgi:Zn-dependent protease